MVELEAEQLVRKYPGITVVGRIGWFAKGIVYVVAGVLALVVALRAVGLKKSDAGGEASPTGAIKELSQHSFGGLVLLALAAGLIVYSGWRLVSALMPGRHELKIVAVRVGYVVSAFIYLSFAFSALQLIGDRASGANGNSKVTDLSRSIMRHTGGRVVIGLVGAVLIGVGIYRADKGRTKDVNDELDLSSMSIERRFWTRRVGAVGEIGRGIAVLLIGFFLVRAAITYEPEDATGLDGALRRAAAQGWSRILVAIVAVGFVCYGVFCLATFTRRRFEAPT